jgi:hypothetical protein
MTSPATDIWVALGNNLAEILMTLIGGWVSIALARIKANQDRAAKATKQVADTLAASTDSMKADLGEVKEIGEKNREIGEKTLTHVNHERGTLLRVVSLALRSTAELTKRPEAIRAAEEAELAYAEHMAGQAKIDAEAKEA